MNALQDDFTLSIVHCYKPILLHLLDNFTRLYIQESQLPVHYTYNGIFALGDENTNLQTKLHIVHNHILVTSTNYFSILLLYNHTTSLIHRLLTCIDQVKGQFI